MESAMIKRQFSVFSFQFSVLLLAALLLAGPAWAAENAFIQKSDGWYAPSKDPAAVLDYDLDWSAWLGTDTISVSDWTVDSGLTSGAQSNTGAVATIWLQGGKAGETYNLKNTITTKGGRIQVRRFKITCRER